MMSEGALTLPRPAPTKPLLRMLPDDRLAKLAAEGSVPAFAAIYARHHQQVYRYCRSILGGEHDARDALQNTMEKAFRALEGETREIALRPWLFRIAHNESVSLIRSRTGDAPMEHAADQLVATEADPETRQRLRELMEDLELLTDRQRSALVMRELSGLEFGEIGAALETSPEGAKQAVYEARVALHDLAEGREMTCEEIRRKISAEDRRLLRGRRVRAHLRSCERCSDFERGLDARKRGLAAIAPPLPAPAAVAILESVIGGGGLGGGGLAAGGGLAGIFGGGAAMKVGAAGLAALAVGAGVYAESKAEEKSLPQSQSHQAEPAPAGSAPRAHGDGSGAANGESGQDAGGSGAKQGDASVNGGGQDGGGPGAHDPDGSGEAAGAGAPHGAAGVGEGPATVPPGQGATPPGQGGLPPGLGTPPPGQGGLNPGLGVGPPITPPGQGGIPPGQVGTPPGGGGPPIPPPGQGGTPPGQLGTPPGGGPPITIPGQGGLPPSLTG